MAHHESDILMYYAYFYHLLCYELRSPVPKLRHKARSSSPNHEALWSSAHAAWAPVATRAFAAIGIGASLVRIGPQFRPPWQPAYGHRYTWHPIHSLPFTVGSLELQHGRGRERVRYNEHWLGRIKAERRHFLTEHSGFNDLFVPMVSQGNVIAAIISGPFLARQPTATSVVEQWRRLAGHDAVGDDPQFVHFLDILLATPVLTGQALRAFVTMLRSVAKLLSNSGDASLITRRIGELLLRANSANLDRDMNAAVSTMIDERL